MRGTETHGRRGDVSTTPVVVFPYLIDTVAMSHPERNVLSCRVKKPRARDRGPPDFTARRERGNLVSFINDPQRGGGYDGGVVGFYNPGVILLQANRNIVTDPGFRPVDVWQCPIRVHGETTIRGEAGVESDDNRLDGCVSWIISCVTLGIHDGVGADAHSSVRHFHCSVWVRHKECKGALQELAGVGDCGRVDTGRNWIAHIKVIFQERWRDAHAVHPEQASKEILCKEDVGKILTR